MFVHKVRLQLSIVFVLVAAVAMQSCGSGGGNSEPAPPPPTYAIGGTVSGLSGTGLALQNNGADDLSIVSDGTFTFATKLADGAGYNVTVKDQPIALTQTCTASSSTGTVLGANVTSVLVSCSTNTYSLGGTVSGLTGTGLTLLNNGGDGLMVSAGSTTFVFATWIADGAPYSVTVGTQPSSPTQNCLVSSGSGTVNGAIVTDVAVTCAALLATGSICSTDGDCDSGNCECADASCSTKKCSTVSYLCGYTTTGTSLSGYLTVGIDPNNDCPGYLCDGAGACQTTCAANNDCDADAFCDVGGLCVSKFGLGSACLSASQCSSGFCYDGYCCESACAGTCDNTGTCTPP